MFLLASVSRATSLASGAKLSIKSAPATYNVTRTAPVPSDFCSLSDTVAASSTPEGPPPTTATDTVSPRSSAYASSMSCSLCSNARTSSRVLKASACSLAPAARS
eukprot:CAMPEP_0185277164 /NCGR_PEP_ID=MMETSP1359-20130426/57986_1 /TAXON_ID=552665 /ORGANISM="Bigelowiella longifila, Strain CCMP242" /LENGTH=104 /DNA_ID=CAMNT_0027871175 /DNA_START=50 /DNA_END=361 /DNA_ORIENTATION=+